MYNNEEIQRKINEGIPIGVLSDLMGYVRTDDFIKYCKENDINVLPRIKSKSTKKNKLCADLTQKDTHIKTSGVVKHDDGSRIVFMKPGKTVKKKVPDALAVVLSKAKNEVDAELPDNPGFLVRGDSMWKKLSQEKKQIAIEAIRRGDSARSIADALGLEYTDEFRRALVNQRSRMRAAGENVPVPKDSPKSKKERGTAFNIEEKCVEPGKLASVTGKKSKVTVEPGKDLDNALKEYDAILEQLDSGIKELSRLHKVIAESVKLNGKSGVV